MPKITEIIINNLDQAMSKEFVFIDFYASWCAPCKQILPIIEKLAEAGYKEVDFYKADAGNDELRDFTNYMNIRNIPTYVIIKNGVEVARASGVMTTEKFKTFIDSAI